MARWVPVGEKAREEMEVGKGAAGGVEAEAEAEGGGGGGAHPHGGTAWTRASSAGGPKCTL